jgi:hypothetical protein
MSNAGAASRAVVSVSNARAEASRRNGARSRGPKTAEGKASSARNALKHGLRAQKHVVLPEEDAAEFKAIEAALIEELGPVGPLRIALARGVAVAAWRLARPDRWAAGTGLGPRSPTRRPRSRGFRRAPYPGRQPRAVAGPRRQRHPQLRDPAVLPRRRDGRAHARAPHPQGAPGRGGRGNRGVRGAGASRPRRATQARPAGAGPHRPRPAPGRAADSE